MRQFISLFVAAIALGLVGCSVEPFSKENGNIITIKATIAENSPTKTVIQDGTSSVLWESGDEVKVFYKTTGSRFTSNNSEPAGTADFTGNLTITGFFGEGFTADTPLWAVYPYRADAVSDGESVTTTLPSAQTGRAGSFAKSTNITLAKSSNTTMGFYNVCGGIRFSLTQEGINEVVFEGQNDEDIAGKVKLGFVDGIPSVQEVTEGEKAITLSAPYGQTFETGKWYYIVALPGTLSGGFKMTFNTATQYATLTSSASRTIKRGIFGSLADADENLSFTDKEDVIPVESISLDKTQQELVVGETAALVVTVTPSDATVKSVTWSSSNPSVASVSPSGVVTGISTGTAMITATTVDGGKTATCTVTVNENSAPSMPVPEAVDLGLSVKWASFNLGASAPEEYGDYYAWGETEPYYTSLDPLNWKPGKGCGYDWPAYQWCMGTGYTLTKYCNREDFGYNEFSDDKRVLDIEDDAAYVNLGDKWRMPSGSEFDELKRECTWTWTTNNGIYGYLVTSNKPGYTDISIFIPAAGKWIGTVLSRSNVMGYYWKNGCDPDFGYACDLCIEPEGSNSMVEYRCYGFSIRPVFGDPSIPVQSVSLDQTEIEIPVGNSESLHATIFPENATNKTLTWSSNNESAATVSSSGVVTGVAPGRAVITATAAFGGVMARCYVTISQNSSPSMAIPEAVNLGLSVKWASFNLGASSPEGYGDYYAWGETEPYYSSQDPLTWKEGKEAGYSWASYRWCMGEYNTLTKYCSNSEYGYNGFTDNKTVLDLEDDAAYVNLGGSWRMPTDAEWTELRENCTWTWTTQNGVGGRLVTGSNGNSIFLPAAGYRNDTYLYDVGSYGYCWSSSLTTDDPDGAWGVGFCSGSVDRGSYYRYYGFSVRPVYAE